MKLKDAAAFEDAGEKRKECRVCRRDLNGHRRIRDGDGYICPVCDQMEREGTVPDGVPCAECGKKVNPGSLKQWGDIQLCPRCHIEHQEDPKKKVRKVNPKWFESERRRGIMVWVAVAGVLLLIMLLGWMW